MNAPLVLPLPEVARNLWLARVGLQKHYATTGLLFTLDGRLVGDIAEALALEHFELSPPERRTPSVDAITASNQSVQIKASGSSKRGPSFSYGLGFADLLLFFRLDFEKGTAIVLYNGPEGPVRELIKQTKWNSSIQIPLAKRAQLAKSAPGRDMVKLRQ
ncbi:MAG: hypothetical protein ABI155_11190 [Paralcaligenes sp.]